MIFDLYEEINYKRTNKYDKVRYVIDPFYIRTHFHIKIGKSGHQRRSARVFGDNSIEMTILDNDILEQIKNLKNKEIFINRYIITCKSEDITKRYFLKKFNCFTIFFDDNIVIFEFGDKYDVISEDDLNLTLNQVLRENKLNELLHSF
jgi:hypothetical protein